MKVISVCDRVMTKWGHTCKMVYIYTAEKAYITYGIFSLEVESSSIKKFIEKVQDNYWRACRNGLDDLHTLNVNMGDDRPY
jgi:predicted DNA-binding protein (UPF0278 family)